MFGALRRILSAAASSSGCSGIGTQQFGAPLRTLKFFQHDASAAAQQLFGIRFQANSASAGQQTRQLAQVAFRQLWGYDRAQRVHICRPAAATSISPALAATTAIRRLSTIAKRSKASLAVTATERSVPAQQVIHPRLADGLSDGMRRALAAWLGLCTAWVGSMVVLGGLTRLTRSGLSMTDWKFTGEAPPRSQEDWEAEFAKYQHSPEFKAINRGMQLEDFKFIYWMEWAHRMWGRALGLVFVVPAAWFVARGAVRGPLAGRLGLLAAMGATQGLVGWWMVRSGLQEPEDKHSTPHVSPYRLAGHLASAFIIYGSLLWTTLTLALPTPTTISGSRQAAAGALALRRHALPLTALIGLTALSGAFVAGNDAGRAYNTFPLMNGAWVPEEYWVQPGWRNTFESTAAVQLHHRVLALTTLASTCAVWFVHRGSALPRPSRVLLHGLAGMAGLQVCLGVSALLTAVPVSLGTAHQAGALSLLSVALALLYTLQSHGGALSNLRAPAIALPGLAASAAVLGIGVYVSQSH